MMKPVRRHRRETPTAKPGAPAARRYGESRLQMEVVKRLRAAGEWAVLVENDGRKTRAQAMRWRAMGGQPGYPDVQLPLRLIAIEFKKPEERGRKNGGCTREQLAAHEALRRHGWIVLVVYAIEDVPSWLLNGEKEPTEDRPNTHPRCSIDDPNKCAECYAWHEDNCY